MQPFVQRKLKFKAWNAETGLLMRLHTLDCVKGELVRENHFILQFTGKHDKNGEELYEMDLVLVNSERMIISWCDEQASWCFRPENEDSRVSVLTRKAAEQMVRLCCYFESRER